VAQQYATAGRHSVQGCGDGGCALPDVAALDSLLPVTQDHALLNMQDEPTKPALLTKGRLLSLTIGVLAYLGSAWIGGFRELFQAHFLTSLSPETLRTVVGILSISVLILLTLCGFLAWPHLKRLVEGWFGKIAWRQGIKAAEHRERIKRMGWK
jgi:hypothetical protein